LFDTSTFAGTILHKGSGLSLSSTTTALNLTNFIIDTTALKLLGDVDSGALSLLDVPLFDIGIGIGGTPGSPFTLAVTAQAAGALTALFGAPNLTGLMVGTANTVPITTAVPEPATVAAMLAGLGLMALVVGYRQKAAREDNAQPKFV